MQFGHILQNDPFEIQTGAAAISQCFSIEQNPTASQFQACKYIRIKTSVPEEEQFILPAVQDLQKKAICGPLIAAQGKVRSWSCPSSRVRLAP